MFLTFANITFQGVKLPQTWDGTFETAFGQIPIIGAKPVVQKTGERADEYSISAYFHVDFCDPRAELEALQKVRKAATVSNLVDGTGKNYGKFVLTSIEVYSVTSLDNGYPISISLSIRLLEYTTNLIVVKNEGQALKSNNPTKEIAALPKTSPAMAISADITAAKITAGTLQAKIPDTKPSTGKFREISSLASKAKEQFDEANKKIEETKKIAYRAIDLKDSVTMVTSALDDIKSAADINSINDLLTANNKLTNALYYMEKSNVPVIAFIASRERGN